MKYVIWKIFKIQVCELNWAIQFEDWDLNWGDIFNVSFQSLLSTRLRYFQFKILHRYLPVNKLLTQIGMIDYNVSTCCNRESENTQHFFFGLFRGERFLEQDLHSLKNFGA